MDLKRMVCASTLAAGVGVAGLFGIGLGTASADPGWHCGAPNAPQCQNNDGRHDNGPYDNGRRDDARPPVDWQQRGIDEGRGDHQPFMWNGRRVDPMPAGDGHGWGYWFLGRWMPL